MSSRHFGAKASLIGASLLALSISALFVAPAQAAIDPSACPAPLPGTLRDGRTDCTRQLAINADGSINVQGGSSGGAAGFTPDGAGVSQPASVTTSQVALPGTTTDTWVTYFNPPTNGAAHIKMGTSSSVTAALTDQVVASGATVSFPRPSNVTNTAVILEAGSANILVTSGTGGPLTGFGGGGGSGTGGGAVTAALNAFADGSIVSIGLKADATGCTYNGTQAASLICEIAALYQAISSGSIPAGNAHIGSIDISQATPGQSNAIQPIAGTTGGATPFSVVSAASANPTPIKTGAGTLYSFMAENPTSALYYIHLYDVAGTPTCTSTTGIIGRFMIPHNTGSGGGFTLPLGPNGLSFTNGLGFRLTPNVTDGDSTSAVAGILVNGSFK